MQHRPGIIENAAPATIPVPRFPTMEWPGDDDRVAFVPVALLLAARGNCSCPDCCDGFARMVGKARLHAV